jgi:hypothetical protein
VQRRSIGPVENRRLTPSYFGVLGQPDCPLVALVLKEKPRGVIKLLGGFLAGAPAFEGLEGQIAGEGHLVGILQRLTLNPLIAGAEWHTNFPDAICAAGGKSVHRLILIGRLRIH